MPAGRPKKTLDDLPDNWKLEMLTRAKDGESDVELRINALGGISDDLWYRFIEEEPEFSRTLKECRLLQESWWNTKGRGMVGGDSGNAAVWIFNMKNRFGWKDKTETEHKGKIIIQATDLDQSL